MLTAHILAASQGVVRIFSSPSGQSAGWPKVGNELGGLRLERFLQLGTILLQLSGLADQLLVCGRNHLDRAGQQGSVRGVLPVVAFGRSGLARS